MGIRLRRMGQLSRSAERAEGQQNGRASVGKDLSLNLSEVCLGTNESWWIHFQGAGDHLITPKSPPQTHTNCSSSSPLSPLRWRVVVAPFLLIPLGPYC